MIYYAVRQQGARHNYAETATPDLAAKKAKAACKLAGRAYTVFKVTEQEHGTYRPSDTYSGS